MTIRGSTLIFTLALVLFSQPALAADQVYVVQKNDTLSAIAKRHRTTVALLVQHNSLKEPDKIYPGQKIRIPGSKPALDAALRKKLDQASVERNRWRHIVIHHSATSSGNPEGMDRFHRENRRMENGLAYHFVIGNGRGMRDGEIAIGGRWTDQLNGGHLSSFALNQRSIGICLVGNFDEGRPTAQQMESLHALVDYLLKRCDLAPVSVRTHQQINTLGTHCPGRHFPLKTFFKELK